MYRSELWTPAKMGNDAVAKWERKVSRREYGTEYVNNEWKIQTSEE
jgi:hypothetical protein